MKSYHGIVAALAAFCILLSTPASHADPMPGMMGPPPPGAHGVTQAARQQAAATPTAQCSPQPGSFTELPSVGGDSDTSVDLQIGYDADTQRLCYVSTSLPEAPVIRVGVGHTLSIGLTNTLQDTGPDNTLNCPIDSFEGEGNYCLQTTQFSDKPGVDGAYYRLMANQAVSADGSSNLHVHGLMVSPRQCSDDTMNTTIYPSNWGGTIDALPYCQTAPNSFTYTYTLPTDHPAGLYWYHDHRHGAAEQETQMGLAGAIVVEDAGDAYRQSIGVTDEVLVVTDRPKHGCLIGVSCDITRAPAPVTMHPIHNQPAATAAPQAPPGLSADTTLDPRIDQVDQAGCATGAVDSTGGIELWTLRLNGADVPESAPDFPPDSELLGKTMQPGQRQIFRLANASADSFIVPELILSQNGTQTVQPLEVFARDGVGLADSSGTRHFTNFNVAQSPLVVPPAGRIEFVVHAPPVGATLYLQSAQFAPGCGGNAYPARRLLLITSAGTPVSPGAADDSDLLTNEPSMASYLNTLAAQATVHRTLVFSEYGRGFTYGVTNWLSGPPTTADYDPSQTDFYITEVASDAGDFVPHDTTIRPFNMNSMRPQITVHLGGQQRVTEQWLIQNSTLEAHAFHIHQIHFRDITTNSTDPDLQPILDTIDVPPAALVGNVTTGVPGTPGYAKLLMTFTKKDIGTFMFHCHILEHEDNGMMGTISVVAN
jgi:FtsP/CotA-like multicopper oxidase with cupredoxin domain